MNLSREKHPNLTAEALQSQKRAIEAEKESRASEIKTARSAAEGDILLYKSVVEWLVNNSDPEVEIDVLRNQKTLNMNVFKDPRNARNLVHRSLGRTMLRPTFSVAQYMTGEKKLSTVSDRLEIVDKTRGWILQSTKIGYASADAPYNETIIVSEDGRSWSGYYRPVRHTSSLDVVGVIGDDGHFVEDLLLASAQGSLDAYKSNKGVGRIIKGIHEMSPPSPAGDDNS